MKKMGFSIKIFVNFAKNSMIFSAQIQQITIKISKCHKPDLLQLTFSENLGLNAFENPNLMKSGLWQ